MEDVAALRAEVQRLRAEIEDLRAENARFLDNAYRASGTQDAAALATLKVEFNNKLAAQRRETNAETDRKIAKLATATNAALADFRRQVNAAIGKATPAPIPATGTPQPPLAEPSDLPRNAIKYKVKQGDTLGKIATANRSKLSWILYVNEGLNPNRLQVGSEILVPQVD